MLIFLILFAFVLSAVYLHAFNQLEATLQTEAPDYWAEIGQPRRFSGRDVSAVLNHLYTRRMREALPGDRQSLLHRVRVLLPLGLAVNGVALYVVYRFLESSP